METVAAPPFSVQATDLGEAVTAAVREMILSGEVSPGERLVETELSAKFGTSRGPVRDAFKSLEEGGLLRAEPRRGTFVVELSDGDIDEIYTLRAALETTAARLYAARVAPDAAADFEQALAALLDAQGRGDHRASAEADMGFHRRIVHGAGQRRLREAWERLADQTQLLLTQLADIAPEIQAAAGDHQEIADAIVAGDGEAAATILHGHFERARQAMLDAR